MNYLLKGRDGTVKKAIRRLPDSELEVMQALWRCKTPAKRSDLQECLDADKPIAVTTLLTLLTRLHEKGFIKIEKQGRGSVYLPLISDHDYQASQSNRFFNQLFKGNLSAFASALSDSGLSKDEIEELRELLRRNEL